MTRLRSWLDLRVTHRALGVSRALYHAAVFWLVLDLWRWQEVAFARNRGEAALLLPVALVVNAALILGLWTRVLLFANAVLLRVIFGLCLDSYTVDQVVENTSLVLALAPAPRALSLDSRRSVLGDPREPVPLGFVLLVFTALALIYGDGLRYKFASEIWRQGSAFWLGAALPHFSTGLLPQWAEVGWLMKACTYGALAYEVLFPLILVRPLRAALACLGVAVHLGSAVFMALPQFGLLMTSLVVLFVPWERPGARVGAFRREAPSASTPRPGPAAAYVLIALMVAGQVWLNYAPRRPLLCRVLGLYQRAIFIDWHFLLPGPLLRFTVPGPRGEVVIPSFDDHGYPMVFDRYWKLFGFTLRAPNLDWREPALRYVRGYCERSGARPAEVRVYCRDVQVRTLALDFGADDEHRRRSWVPCGTISFSRR